MNDCPGIPQPGRPAGTAHRRGYAAGGSHARAGRFGLLPRRGRGPRPFLLLRGGALLRQLIQQQMAMEAQKLGNSNRRREALVILAPTDGQISNLNAVIGGQVAAGEQVGEIGVLTDYKVTARLNEYYIDRVQSGLPATAMLKGHKYSFEVSRTTPQVQEHSFAVELKPLEVDKASLRLGQTLRLQIELGKPERRLIIPRGNFYAQTSGQWIMLVDETGQRARRVPIKLGRQNTEHYEVISGLNTGDCILISGYESFGDAEALELKSH